MPNQDQNLTLAFSGEPAADPSTSELESSQAQLLKEQFLLSVIQDMKAASGPSPLQCVTYKMPLPDYFRMKKASQRWRVPYSELLRHAMRLVIPVLESPAGELRELLEQHLAEEISRDEQREKRKRRYRELIAG